MTDGQAVLALGVSLLAVMLLTIVAGTSQSAANASLAFIVGLWLVYLIQHPGLGSAVTNTLGAPA